MLLVLAVAGSAGATKPRLEVRLVKGMQYSVAASPSLPSDQVYGVAVRMGRQKSSIIGSSVEHRHYRRQARSARVRIELHDDTRDERGALVSSKVSVIRDRVALPGKLTTGQATYRGPNGTVIFAKPMFNYEVFPTGIPVEQIERVTYIWPQLRGSQYGPRVDLEGDKHFFGARQPFGMSAYAETTSFPVAATVHLKNGQKLELEAYVGVR